MTGVGTDHGALAAPDTLRRRVEDLRRMFPRLRIVTPDTAQRTPFEKYRCPDTRTVMDGKLLNIKNDCSHKKNTFGLLHLYYTAKRCFMPSLF